MVSTQVPQSSSHTPKTNVHLNARRTVLLQTAVAEDFNQMKHNRKERVKVVLDSESQHSYLTEHLRLRLGLESVSTQNLAFAVFGSRREAAIL